MSTLQSLCLVCAIFLSMEMVDCQMLSQTRRLLNYLRDSCSKETGTPLDLIEKFNKGVYSTSRHLSCYMKCLMQQTAVMDDDGSIYFEPLSVLIPDNMIHKARKVFDECNARANETDQCDKAYHMIKCGHELNPEFFKLI